MFINMNNYSYEETAIINCAEAILNEKEDSNNYSKFLSELKEMLKFYFTEAHLNGRYKNIVDAIDDRSINELRLLFVYIVKKDDISLLEFEMKYLYKIN